MAGSSEIRAGRAFVELSTKDKLTKGLNAAKRRLDSFGKSIGSLGLKVTALGAAGVAAFIPMIDAAGDAAETFNKFQATFGKNAEAAGKFVDDLAKNVGRSVTDIQDSMSGFQGFFVGLGFAGDQATGLSETMQQLALDFASFNNTSDDDAVQRFISAMSGSGEVLDRYGINLKQAALDQELLKMGIAGGVAKATEQQKALARLNIIMAAMGQQGAIGDAVKTSGSFANQMKRLMANIKDTSIAIGQALLPVVTPLVTKATEVATMVAQWAKANQPLIASIFKIAAVVTAAGAALVVLGGAIVGLGSVMGAMATVTSAVGTAFAAIGTVIGALVSPIGLVAAAVAGLGVYLIEVSGAGGKAMDWLGQQFGALRDVAFTAFQGISDALAAGDIGLAAKILWATLKMEWLRGIAALEGPWMAFREFFEQTASDAFYGALIVLNDAWATMQIAWVETTNFLANTWTSFTTGLQKAWNTAENWLTKGWLKLMGLFDKGLDVNAAVKLADQEATAANQQLDQQAQKAIAGRNTNRDQQRTAIENQRQATETQIVNDGAAADAKRKDQNSVDLAASQKALDDAKTEWQNALAEAKQKRAALPAGAGPGELPKLNLPKLGAATAGKQITSGTFNAFAVQSLQGGGSVAERTAKAAEATADNTKKIARVVQGGGGIPVT